MIEHKNRVPGAGKANRKLITPEGGGAAFNAVVTFDDSPVDTGQPVTKAMLDEFLAASGATTGTGDAFLLAQAGFALADGATVRMKLHAAMNKGATVNVAGSGAKPIVDSLGKGVKAAAGSWVTVVYSSTNSNFTLQGSGGEAKKVGMWQRMLTGNFI